MASRLAVLLAIASGALLLTCACGQITQIGSSLNFTTPLTVPLMAGMEIEVCNLQVRARHHRL